MLELTVRRRARRDTYTIGSMEINADVFCDTLEDTDRGLTSSMSLEEIAEKKVYGQTAIPCGHYRVDMDTVSPKYSKIEFYQKTCDGKLPRLVGVPGYSGVLIHCGNTAADTDGCIIIGENKAVGKVLNSRATFTRFIKRLQAAHDAGEEIWITIK